MKRRGASQIEFVLSFVLFLGATLFIIFAFNPVKTSLDMNPVLTQASNALFKDIFLDVEKYSVKVNPGFITGSSVAIDLGDIQGGLSAEDYKGTYLGVRKGDDEVYLEVNKRKDDFVYILNSKDIIQSKGGLGDLNYKPMYNPKAYSLGAVQRLKTLSEKKLLELNKSYYSDYDALKEKFGVPLNSDFEANFKFGDNEVKMEKSAPASVEIFSQQYRKEMLKTDGEIVFADIIVKIW
jgi:hypothetical protein